ncbi:MAG TPA: 2'-5' RNA ligase family protein [Dehalococcoidia bacterium]|nr:2'-5' RNA ligase family protein [Dehalococcoidia bacterium]
MPLFTSFDDAWRWFEAGGALVPLDERREAFAKGRAQFVAFQAPAPSAAGVAAQALDALAGVAGLQPTPDDLLHVTLLPVGFQVIRRTHPDDVLPDDVARAGAQAARALEATRPFDVRVGPVSVFPDALVLEVHDGGPLRGLRASLRSALGRPYEDDAAYLPHITIATFADGSCADDLRRLLPALRDRTSRAPVRRIDLARWWFVEGEETEMQVIRTYRLR